jgi:heme exporter protein D
MSFASFSDVLAMGRHGLYVWAAYGCCLLVLAWNLAMPALARRRLRAQAARQTSRGGRL